MGEEPEQVLPKNWRAIAADLERCSIHNQARGQEEAGIGQSIHELQYGRSFKWRKGHKQKEGRDELGPDEKRHAEPGHTRCAHLNDCYDEIHGTQKG